MSTKTTEKLKAELASRDEPTGKQLTASQLLAKTINEQAPAFGALLPKGAEREKFEVQLASAVKSTPELLKCLATSEGQVSLILAARQAASLGLEVNTLLHESFLEPRKRKIRTDQGEIWIDECRLNIGWRGYVKLAEEATGGKIDAEVVHEGDYFKYGYSLGADTLDHIPEYDDDAEKTHVWARIKFPDGRAQFVVMKRKAVEKRRAMSDTWKSDQKYGKSYSPWSQWEDEQWLKTAVRTLCKRIRISPIVARALETDDAPLKVDASTGTEEIVSARSDEPEGEATAEPETPPEPTEGDVELDPGRPFEESGS